MGINISAKTKKPEALRLYNAINSFLFDQEFDELKNEKEAIEALRNAKSTLAKLIAK